MRGSRTTSNLILAGALGLGSLVTFAAPALAETPPHQGPGFEIALPEEEDTTLDDIVAPAPEPEVNDDKAPLPQPEPQPDPQQGDDKVGPNQDPDEPGPQQGDDKVGPNQDPGDGPGLDGPDDITSDPGCNVTHGDCDEDDEPTPDGHCFDDAGNVVDVSECMPSEDDEPNGGGDSSTEVGGSTTDRTALPRTGAGLTALAAAGLALVGGGAAARKAARR